MNKFSLATVLITGAMLNVVQLVPVLAEIPVEPQINCEFLESGCGGIGSIGGGGGGKVPNPPRPSPNPPRPSPNPPRPSPNPPRPPDGCVQQYTQCVRRNDYWDVPRDLDCAIRLTACVRREINP